MLLSFLLSCAVLSETPDTLSAASVISGRAVTVSRTDTIAINNSLAPGVSGIMLRTPGIVLSDYGGAAGLKTVSLRGLGSPHTAIRIDGIKVSNVQSGQGDLGLLGIENCSAASVDYAQNSVDFITSRPVFENGRRVGGKAILGAGSFGTWLPYARCDFKLSENVALSVNGAGNISDGNFLYGDGMKRENNWMKQYKAGMDAFGLMKGGDWTAKAYVSGAGRGTPGSVDWPSDDHQKDLAGFIQGRMRKNFGRIYSMDICAKASYDDIRYFSSYGDSRYGQTGVQVGSGNRFHPLRWLDLSLTADFDWESLRSTNYDASRISASAAAGVCFSLPRFKADLTIEYDGTFDSGGLSSSVLSPAADFRWEVGGGVALCGFARRAFRAPTFNELYYPGYGNPILRPEDAILSDLGIDWKKSFGKQWTAWAKADGFFNFLKDKITSAPSPEDPNIWMPYNIGTVKAYGLDAETGFMYMDKDWKASFSARYSYQEADGVPYLSRHSIVLSGELTFRGWSLVPVWNYRGGRHDSYGDMPDWNTLDLTFSKSIRFSKCGPLTLAFIVRNVTDTRYELVSSYPFPSRSFLGCLSFQF